MSMVDSVEGTVGDDFFTSESQQGGASRCDHPTLEGSIHNRNHNHVMIMMKLHNDKLFIVGRTDDRSINGQSSLL